MTRPLRLVAAILCTGAALQVLLWSRQWIYGDQYALLLAGIGVLETGDLPPFAKTMSGGGRVPGALLPLLVAAPLQVWADYRAPGLLIGLSHVAAAAVLAACIGRALGVRFLAAYLAVYWLSPWRLYHAGFVWEPAYLFLPAALHLASAYRLRERPHAGWSLLHAANLTLALQLHGSFLVLALLTAGLAGVRRIRLDVRGCVLGVLAGALTLIPTAQAFVTGTLPQILPGRTDELARPLIALVNLPKSLAYWWRLGSLYIGRRLDQTVYAEAAASETGSALASGLTEVVIALSTVSVAVAVFASWRYFRRHPSFEPDDPDRTSPAEWLCAYAGWCLAALCVAATVSPVPVQGWHVVIAFHAACLPVAAWIHAAFRARSPLPRAAAAGFVLLEVIVVIMLAFGHPMYRPVSGEALIRQDLPDAVRTFIPDRTP